MDTELEQQILQLAVQRNVLSERQLSQIDQELHEQQSTRDGGLAPSEGILSLLLKKGIITQELIDSLIEELQGQRTGKLSIPAADAESRDTYVLTDSAAERVRIQAVASTRTPEPKTFGKYTQLQFLGQGGMAKVYRAYDPTLDRWIALKFVRVDTPEFAERLAMEARTQAKVEHEHICKVYEVGESEGRNYIAMQFIQGKTLKDCAAEMTLMERVRLMMQVSDALYAAHRVGLIHRDLKPANIMVEKRDGERWIPYVMDFGLAREVEAVGVTQTGMAVGTPSYMSPEQARGEIHRVDRHTDIYSIGATLYELATGRPPFQGDSSIGILLKVIQQDPPAPRQIQPSVPADLETIILKCIEKDPARRFDTARELADDLRRFLEGEAVQAKPPSWSYKASKKIRKHSALATVIGAAVVVVLALAGFAANNWWKSQKKEQLAAEFGQELQYLQERVRYIYTDDLHDVRADEAEIEKRLQQLEARMKAEGPIALGPGHYALGQGYLTLHQYEVAEQHLERAWHKYNYRIPQTAYAYGSVLAMLYQKELARTAHKGNQQNRLLELEKKYRDPALKLIRSGTTSAQAAEYVEALVAYLEKRYETALAKADAAHKKLPWQYESLRLKGEIYYAMGRAMEATNRDAALRLYGDSEKAYHEVIRHAPGDVQSYVGLSHLHRSVMDLLIGQSDESPLSAYEKGIEACEKGRIADPEEVELLIVEAYLHMARANHIVRVGGEDLTPFLSQTISLAERAMALRPATWQAYFVLGRAYEIWTVHELDNSRNPIPYAEKAIAVLHKGSEIAPNNALFYAALGSVYRTRGQYVSRRGGDARGELDKALEYNEKSLALSSGDARMQADTCHLYGVRGNLENQAAGDPRSFYDKATRHCEEATKLNSTYSNAFTAMGSVNYWKAEYELLHGLDPTNTIEAAATAYNRAIAIKPSDPEGYANVCEAYNLRADYQLRTGRDAGKTAGSALKLCQKSVDLDPTMDFAQLNLGVAYRYSAEVAMSESASPELIANKALDTLKRAQQINAQYPDIFLARARVEWLLARWYSGRGKSYQQALTRARKAIVEALQVNPNYADAMLLDAMLHSFEADQLLKRKKSAAASIQAGLEAIDRALAANPALAEAIAVKGMLLSQQGDADQGRELISKAVKQNANLQHQYRP